MRTMIGETSYEMIRRASPSARVTRRGNPKVSIIGWAASRTRWATLMWCPRLVRRGGGTPCRRAWRACPPRWRQQPPLLGRQLQLNDRWSMWCEVLIAWKSKEGVRVRRDAACSARARRRRSRRGGSPVLALKATPPAPRSRRPAASTACTSSPLATLGVAPPTLPPRSPAPARGGRLAATMPETDVHLCQQLGSSST